jgi:type II secretory pathway pseudopilin PulG
MKVPGGTLRPLYLPLLIAIVLAGIGIAAVIASKQFLDQARVQHKAALADRQTIQSKLSRATDEEREIREKLVDYRKLLARGVIGDERRLDWVETIGQIKNENKLAEIRYQIEPQRTLDLPGVSPSSGVEFRVSALKVEMQLLHEGDLLVFIDGLRSKLKAHVLVRSCAIKRLDSGQERGIAPRLRADCVIDLVTIRDKQLKSS